MAAETCPLRLESSLRSGVRFFAGLRTMEEYAIHPIGEVTGGSGTEGCPYPGSIRVSALTGTKRADARGEREGEGDPWEGKPRFGSDCWGRCRHWDCCRLCSTSRGRGRPGSRSSLPR